MCVHGRCIGEDLWEGRGDKQEDKQDRKGAKGLHLALVKKWSWNRDNDRVLKRVELLPAHTSSVLGWGTQRMRLIFYHDAAHVDSALSSENRASQVNSTPPECVPRWGVLSRKSSICFPLLQQLLRMSSFLLEHPCVAEWEKCHQENKRTLRMQTAGTVTLLNLSFRQGLFFLCGLRSDFSLLIFLLLPITF